jgi:pimeloyl-ACP methyl ester carboxylesterase/DNA-binding CsgD family transcriptional regulator
MKDATAMDVFEPLNSREKEILMQISLGLVDQDIADRLFLSLNTVKWYNRHIYGKLAVRNRTQALAKARELGLLDPAASPAANSFQKGNQKIQFTNSFDGTRIAYASAGNGPPLVKAANYMGHLNFDWESPVWGHWLAELTRGRTLIRYDERGSGMSATEVADVSFDAWVRDLDAVVEAANLDRFVLFGMSQGGAVAVAYAAQHPERVSKLVLHGSYARGWLKRELTATEKEQEKLLLKMMRVGWGEENPAFRQVFAMQLFPEATTAQLHALEEQMRLSATPKNAVRLEKEMHHVDVQQLARQVKAPTLVLHSSQDGAVPYQEGLLLANLIPSAQFVSLESKNHLVTEGEPAWAKFQEAFRKFLID